MTFPDTTINNPTNLHWSVFCEGTRKSEKGCDPADNATDSEYRGLLYLIGTTCCHHHLTAAMV